MRELIRLVSSAGTGHFYTTDKNKRTKPEKIEIKKYDPVVPPSWSRLCSSRAMISEFMLR